MDKINKRVIIFHPTIAPYRIDLFNTLCEQAGADVYLLMHEFSVFKDYQKILDKLSFEPKYVYADKSKDKTRAFSPQFWKIIDEQRPDTVISFEFSACTMMVLLKRWFSKKKFKVVTMCDDSPNMIKNASLRHRIVRNICCRYVDDIILCSPEVRDWYKSRFNKGVYFPIIRDEKVALPLFESTKGLAQQLKEQYGLEGKRIYLFVGRIAPEKNIGYLLESFKRVRKDNETLIIVGDGPELSTLKEKYPDIAIFVGRKEDPELTAFYNAADIFILPSTFEPFGAVTNEALLAGCFSLISTYCGSKCLIKEGQNGFTFNPDDENGLADAIIKARNISFEEKHSLMKDSFSELFKSITAIL